MKKNLSLNVFILQQAKRQTLVLRGLAALGSMVVIAIPIIPWAGAPATSSRRAISFPAHRAPAIVPLWAPTVI